MAVQHVVEHLSVSERRACRVLGQSRATQRYLPQVRDDETLLTKRIIELAAVYGRYGLNRAWVLQEQGGYMKVVLEIRPHLETTIEAMKRDHARLQGVLDVVILQLDRVSPSDRETFINLRDEFLEFLEDLKNHNVKETHLSQEAFMQEEGGEA